MDAGGRVKFAYLSADFANPTGVTISQKDRHRLLDLAHELDIAIIEDAAYQSLRYDGDAIPPILALDVAREGTIEATRTLYCGSFSKTLSPGLRVGWTIPEGGMFIWLTLPEHLDGVELLATSLETEKVAFIPGSAFYADRSVRNTIRLSFPNADETKIDEGVSRLGQLLERVMSS